MLPTGRGQAPIPWTIIKDQKKTALSVFFLVSEADAGPLIAQYELDVRNGENNNGRRLRFRCRDGEVYLINDELQHAHHHAPTASNLPLGHTGIACYAKAGIGNWRYRKFRKRPYASDRFI